VAVLAGGLSSIYPPEHVGLADEVAKNGALVTESSMMMEPQRGMFHARNRLISGLAQAVVIIGDDRHGCEAAVAGSVPVLHAALIPRNAGQFAGRRLFAFAGIGRPAKFYATLEALGAEIVERRDFPDHHRYRPDEVSDLIAAARARGALAVTTAKDLVRLPDDLRPEVGVLEVEIAWRDKDALVELLTRSVLSPRTHD